MKFLGQINHILSKNLQMKNMSLMVTNKLNTYLVAIDKNAEDMFFRLEKNCRKRRSYQEIKSY